MARSFLFTSESVTEGHPDKVCDQVSDSILDAILEKDPTGRVAVETLVTNGRVHGEMLKVIGARLRRRWRCRFRDRDLRMAVRRRGRLDSSLNNET